MQIAACQDKRSPGSDGYSCLNTASSGLAVHAVCYREPSVTSWILRRFGKEVLRHTITYIGACKGYGLETFYYPPPFPVHGGTETMLNVGMSCFGVSSVSGGLHSRGGNFGFLPSRNFDHGTDLEQQRFISGYSLSLSLALDLVALFPELGILLQSGIAAWEGSTHVTDPADDVLRRLWSRGRRS